MQIRLPGRSLDLREPQVVGILNVTRDSFYPDSRYPDPEKALERALQMVDEGAAVIEVGGEKAGPGDDVPAEEEMARVLPVIKGIRRHTDVPIAVDSFKPRVVEAAASAGADIINSVDSFQQPALRTLAARYGLAIVVMHIQGEPRVHQEAPRYTDVVDDVRRFLVAMVQTCIQDGVDQDRIIIDFGAGFGKTADHDLALIRRLDVFTALPYPVMLAVSRKGFIGDVLALDVDRRLPATLGLAAWGVRQGVKLIRAHDVKATRRACLVAQAVLQAGSATGSAP